MGPDDGVQRILKTGLASAGAYGVSLAVWTRSGTVFAEGRVFARDPAPEVQGVVETVKVEAKNVNLAVVLLEMQVEKYGSLDQIHWWPSVDSAIETGQRVWVADPEAKGGRTTGVVTSVPHDFLGTSALIVLLDAEKKFVTCSIERCGTQWDFATD